MYTIDKISKEKKRMSIILKIVSIILYIIIIPIIIYNLTLMIKSFINPNKTPDFFGYKSFIIVSRSMEKTINKSDTIFIKEIEENKLNVNDIISFKENDNTITTHRIVKIEYLNGKKYYITKGDNNYLNDKEKVIYEQIEGKYIFKIQGFGNIILILQNKITLITLFIILILNYIYSRQLAKRKKNRKAKRKMYEENNKQE